jgi:hypothetical protein
MTMAHNPNEDQDNNESRGRHIREIFGDDPFIGLATDQPRGTTRTAQTLARDSLAARREQRQAQDVALVQVAAREQDEDEALADVLRVMRRGGGRTPPGTMAKAARALKRRGYHQGTTAEQLARMAGQGQGWRPAS